MRTKSQQRRIQALGCTSKSSKAAAKPCALRGRMALAALAAASSLLSSQFAMATSDTWDGSVSNLWSTSANWASNPGTVPGAGETATFSLSAAAVNNNTTIDLGAGVTLGSLIFDTSNAAAYTIGAGAAGSQILTMDTIGNAIILNSSVTNNQLFNAQVALFNTSTLAFTVGNYSSSAQLTFAGGFTAANSGIKVAQFDGDGQTTVSGAFTAGAGSMNLLKTGNGTLILSGGGTFSGNAVLGHVTDRYPVVLRSGVTKITGGTYSVTGEMVIGGVLIHGDAGNNAKLQMDGGTLNVSSWFSLGRGNGTGGVSNDLELNNNAVLSSGNFSAGYNGGNTLNTPKGSIVMNNTSRLAVGGQFNFAESPGSNYTFTMNGSSSLSVGGEFRVAGTSGTGTFIMNGSSTASVGSFWLGRGDNNTQTAAGTAILNAGTSFRSEGDVVLGFAGNNNLGNLIINGATMNVASTTERWMIIDQWDTSRGQLDMNSGTLNLNANTDMRFFIGNTGTSGAGTVNHNGGAITFYSDNATTISGTGGVIDMARSGSASAVSTYNLNGGTLTVGQIMSTTTLPTRTFNFNGGVIKPTGSTSNWINLGSGSTSLNVLAGGAKIDTDGKDVTIGQPLLGSGGDGGLTKNGAGALTLTGNNTYTGSTVINAGRLVVNGSLSSSASVAVGIGAALDLGNGAAGTLTINGLSLNNNSSLNLEFVNGLNDRIDVLSSVSKTGSTTINLSNTAGALSAGTYTLMTASGGLGSGFVLGSVPAGFFSFSLSASTSTAEILTITGNPNPLVAYWTGVASSGVDPTNKWGQGSTATSSNWSTTADGLTDPKQTPGPATDVIFAATNATGVSGALNTTLDASYSIKSLTIDVPASTGITSVGVTTTGRMLTIGSGGLVQAASSNAAASITGSGSVALGGSQTWSNNSSLPLVVSSSISAVSGATTLTIDGTGSGAVSLGGITDGGGVLSLVVNKPTGATNLSGGSTFSGGATIMAGTLNVAGSLTTPAAVYVGGEGGSGVMNINAGANVTVNNIISVGYRTGTGTLNMTGGTLNTNNDFRVGASDLNGPAYVSAGVANISGGVASLGAVTVGRGNFLDNTVSGTLNISGGTVTSVNDVILGFAGTGGGTMTLSGNGVFNVGSTATKWMMLGYWDQTKGVLDISGGSLNLNYGSSLVFSRQGTVGASSINQTGGWVSTYSDNATTVGGTGGIDMQYVGSASSSSTYNLDGGTLTIFRIFSSASSGTRVFNFNGGTLRPATSDAAFMNLGSGSATVNVRNGGAKIDTNGFNVTIASPLAHSDIPGDAAIDGGLTKNGAGQLILSGNATYTGPTVVNAGTLAINKTNTGGGAITVATGAALTLNSVTATGSLSASSMTLSDSILSFNLGAAFPTAPLYNVSGGLARSGNNVVNVAGSLSSGTITLIQYAGAETGGGSFTLGTLPNRTSATIFDLGAGKVDLAITVNALKWTGIGDGSWTTAVQTPKNWTDGVNPADYTEGDPVLFDDSATGTTVNLPANVAPAGMTVNNSTKSYTLTGIGGVTGNAALAKTGTNTLYINNTGANSYSGGTTIAAGGTVEFSGVEVTNANIQYLGSGPIVNDGVIVFNRPEALDANEAFNTVFLWNNISGSGSIIASQNGQLGGANTFTGTVTVKSGATLFLDSSGALGSDVGATVVEDGGRIAMYPSMNLGNEAITIAGNGPTYNAQGATNGALFSNGNSTIGGTVTMSGSAAINVGGGVLTLTGSLVGGSNDLTKNGGGRLIIAGPATYNNTVISGGRLQIGNGGTLGNVGSGFISMTGGGIDFRRTDSYTVPNYITGTGVVYNLGTGTVILTNTSSDFFGVIGANAGTMILEGAAFASTIQVDGAGTVRVANDNYGLLLSIATINSNNAETGAMELSNGVSNPFGGLDLNFAGRNSATTGLRSVNGTNTLNSNIVLNAGGGEYRIEAAAGGSFNITGGISGNGTLGGGNRLVTFDGAGVGTMSGVISTGGAGTLNVAKIGTGTWTLNNANSYNGTTIANGGTLVLVGSAKSPVLTGAGGDVLSGRLVLDYADDGTVPAQVLAALDAGYDQSPKFSSGKLFTTNPEASATGLGWKNDAGSQRVTIAYTYYGDTNLDGQVDITDLAALATAWQTPGVWVNGDANYDGFIDITDLAALATNWQLGVGAPLAMSFDQALASVGLGGVSVPEPTAMGLLGICLAGAVSRRRGRNGVK